MKHSIYGANYYAFLSILILFEKRQPLHQQFNEVMYDCLGAWWTYCECSVCSHYAAIYSVHSFYFPT